MSKLPDGDINMIGLHKMAAECGDGLVPELLAMMEDRRRLFEERQALLQNAENDQENVRVSAGPCFDNVVAFRRPAHARHGH